MSIHQTIHDTLHLDTHEVMALIGAGDESGVAIRQKKMRAFLKKNAWDEAAYKLWLRGNNSKPRGLGDTIAKLTKSVGVKPCGGCNKRQAKLNQLFPYKDK